MMYEYMNRSEEKTIKQRISERLLRMMASAVLRKYRPCVVGVTGSVGKSSAKKAAGLVLSHGMVIRESEGNYNNEIGVPLSILGIGTGGNAVTRLVSAFFRFLVYILFPVKLPEVFVLEMGIDRPGDMEYLVDFVPVKVGVITRIAESHIEHFGTIGAIAKEKGKLITTLPEDGFAILNADDERVIALSEKTKAIPITYGFSERADVRAEHVTLFDTDTGVGSSFKLSYRGKTIPVRLPGVVAKHHIEDALAGAAVGIAIDMNLVDIARSLEGFTPLPGRVRFLQGRGGVGILDDTYNASPSSLRAALETLGSLSATRMEMLTRVLLRNPDEAWRLLCRQREAWRKKPFTPPAEWE
jgi:UDP-N-acetylmuramyl pentapeptide synthase